MPFAVLAISASKSTRWIKDGVNVALDDFRFALFALICNKAIAHAPWFEIDLYCCAEVGVGDQRVRHEFLRRPGQDDAAAIEDEPVGRELEGRDHVLLD